MLQEMIPEIIFKLDNQKYLEAFVNLEGLIFFMHENLREFTSDEIFCVVLAHDAISDLLNELNTVKTSNGFNGKIEFCAHLAALRLKEALGDNVSGRAARALSLFLEVLMNKQ
ncbi:MAG: hypothetical protein HGB36_09065 [Chlorobiaceae bacterium]|jgi:hypothetical protein|nr:hypothetical protein [Chlorobiaceae bacterium]